MNGESGSNEPVTTSYDYDAPLSEAGDPTPKYLAIRDTIANLTGQTPPPVPPATAKANYGVVPAQFLGEVTVLLDALAPEDSRIRSYEPKTFENLNFPYGFVMYETVLSEDIRDYLSIPGINDRGYVMINGSMQGVLIQLGGKTRISLSAKKFSKLQILVENNGRQCSGFNDPKGINGNVTADGKILSDWLIYPLSIENIFQDLTNPDKRHSMMTKSRLALKKKWSSSNEKYFAPSIYYTKFYAEGIIEDTFFNPQNWSKGQMFINSFNVGRYWPSFGPQVTLYVPKPALVNLNYVVILELEYPGNCQGSDNFTCYVSFDDKPIFEPGKGPKRALKKYDKSIYLPNNGI